MKTPQLEQRSTGPRTRKFLALFTIAAITFIADSGRVSAATILTFTPQAPRVQVNFESLGSNKPITDLGWTGSNAGSIKGAAPKGGAPYNSSAWAVQADGNTKLSAISPVQTVSPAFTTTNTVYFSALINRNDVNNSGGRIFLQNSTSAFLGGFGIADATVNGVASPFALYANGSWHFSSQSALANSWYEVALVIDMNNTDIALSVGHLFVRNITAGDTQFTLIEDVSNVVMGYSSSVNATAFSSWRIDSFRNGAQIDNINAGIGTLAIPEADTVAQLMTGLILLGCRRKLKSLFP